MADEHLAGFPGGRELEFIVNTPDTSVVRKSEFDWDHNDKRNPGLLRQAAEWGAPRAWLVIGLLTARARIPGLENKKAKRRVSGKLHIIILNFLFVSWQGEIGAVRRSSVMPCNIRALV
jgi:hypothetical protein